MKVYNPHTTIIALSTAVGGALCVVRLSGKDALSIVEKHTGKKFEPRVATFAEFHSGSKDCKVIDQVVVTYYQAPRSFTGEDIVEISCHGSRWIAGEIISQCISSGAIGAGAGEFSQRAFLSGKLDLSQVEAIADIISSSSEVSARIALNQLRGGYSREFAALRSELLRVLSLLELELDFGDEEVEFASRKELILISTAILERIRELSGSFKLGNALKNGVGVAIVGSPNAGKSTLLNVLLQEERAIVSSEAGTTRDFIEAELVIDGILFRFIDTAGIRSDATSGIEQRGIERSLEQLSKADIILHLIDLTKESESENINITEGQTLIKVYSKCDLKSVEHSDGVSISAKMGIGITELKDRLPKLVQGDSSEQTVVSNARHYTALLHSIPYFERAISGLKSELTGELISSELRGGLEYLSEITGEVTSDNILHNIFANHCIGK